MPPSEQALRNREYWDWQADEYQAAHGPAAERRRPDLGRMVDPRGRARRARRGRREGHPRARLRRRALVDRAGEARRPAGRARQLRAATRAREDIDGRGGGGLPADPCLRRGDPASRRLFRHRLLRSRRDSRGPIHTSSSQRSRACCVPAASSPSTCRALFCACVTTRRRRGPTKRLHRSYFDLRIAAEDDGAATYELTDGDWIRLLRANGLSVEALFELRPPDGATTTYGDYVFPEWAAQWPGEHLWKARKG